MKYFIDFEATQFSEEIISIGCIREDGETFYSLVAPIEGKITPFITNLTGITAQMLSEALSPDAVFEQFYDWVFQEEDQCPDFFAWGNSDVDFLRHTFKRTKSHKARMTIGYIAGSLRDYAKNFCKIAKIDSCSLIKAYNVLIDENKTQNHNALDDAVLLFDVYNKVSSQHFSETREIMQKYCIPKKSNPTAAEPPVVTWTQMNFEKGTICMIDKRNVAIQAFKTIDEAAAWVVQRKVAPNQEQPANTDRIKQRIRRAYSSNKPYCGFHWRKIY